MSIHTPRPLAGLLMPLLALCALCGGATAQTGEIQACCQADTSCQMLDPAECDQIGGASAGAGIECTFFTAMTCVASRACCVPFASDGNNYCDNHPVYQCVKQISGVPNFDVAACEELPDSDGDLAVDPCDGCPSDGQKVFPGQCGCFVPDTDSDGDSIADCVDQCPGFNDADDADGDGVPDGCDQCPGSDDRAPGAFNDDDGDGVFNCNDVCPGVGDAVYGPVCAVGLPTVSSWGLVVLTLLLLVVAKIGFHQRRTPPVGAATSCDPRR